MAHNNVAKLDKLSRFVSPFHRFTEPEANRIASWACTYFTHAPNIFLCLSTLSRVHVWDEGGGVFVVSKKIKHSTDVEEQKYL